MGMRWVDVSIPLGPGLTTWPGDPPFAMHALSRIAEGAACNVSALSLTTHTGTHVDAPWHFEADGPSLDRIDSGVFFGRARLIDLPSVEAIHAEHLGEGCLPPRVLFKTRNSDTPMDTAFSADYVAVEEDAARRLVDDGVRLVGIDGLSVAPFGRQDQATHHILLGAGCLLVEGLRLKGLPGGTHEFVVLPLSIVGADGAPCRAFVGIADVADRRPGP